MAPIGDIALAAGLGFGAGIAQIGADLGSRDEGDADTVSTFLLVGAGVVIISSIVGFRRTRRCIEAHDARALTPVPETPLLGTERASCRADRTCDPGLVCASGYCVAVPAEGAR